mmetsp:Transcript_17986/g.30093  ORF Transcript_17986/g.30093 Transcript_17986/m.30093 type:complete len:576 (+) Transcript_17986:99-1826(+)
MSARRSKRVKQETPEDTIKEEAIAEDTLGEETKEVENTAEQLDDYEKIRQENIQRNLEFLDSIGIQDVKSDIHLQQQPVRKPASRGLKRATPSKGPTLPPRRSGRVTIERLKKEIDDSVVSGSMTASQLEEKRGVLEAMVADKAASTYTAPDNFDDHSPKTRFSPDPIPLLTPLNQPKAADEQDSDWGHGLLPLMTADCKDAGLELEEDCAAYRSKLSSLEVVENDVAKVVPQRITSMIIHPSRDRTLVMAGDKQGHVGFWNADEGNNVIGGKAAVGGEDGVYLFRPHVGSASALFVSPHAPHSLWSSSYDGTVRRTDIECQAFVEAYRTPGEYEEVRIQDMAFNGNSSDAAYLACSTGEVTVLDTRSGQAGWTAQFHDGKINSIQVHPQHEHILVTASSGMNGYIAVHDMRKIKADSSKLCQPLFSINRHSKSINAAYLSPGSGQHLVAVSLDNTVSICHDIMSNASRPVISTFSHDNHTGRWLSTLKPSFDPHVEHASFTSFLLGSMAKPRRVEVYTLPSSSPKSVTEFSVKKSEIDLRGEFLGSVCSRNCFHPSQKHVIAGGNSSGKVHLFR